MHSPRHSVTIALISAILKCSAFSNVPCRPCSLVETTNGVGRVSFLRRQTSTPTRLTAIADDDAQETNETEAKFNDIEIIAKSEESVDDTNQGFVAKLKWQFGDQKFNRSSLAKFGTSVPLCYGLISNIFGITCVSIAWFLASRRTGLSPLAPGQWKGFMAIYAAFFAFLNLIRPARFALTLALSKYFDRALNSIQNRFSCNKAYAVGLLLLIQICFSCAFMAFGVALASTLSGVPIFAGRV